MTTPDILLVESDHDMRNSADFLILNKLAKAIFAVPGFQMLQSVYAARGAKSTAPRYRTWLSWTSAGDQQLFLPFQAQNG